MDISVMFLDCPAYMDEHGVVRCGLPAAVEYRYAVSSTDGLLESAKIRCPLGHWFNGPLESLTWEKDRTMASPGPRRARAAMPVTTTEPGSSRASPSADSPQQPDPPAENDRPALEPNQGGVA